MGLENIKKRPNCPVIPMKAEIWKWIQESVEVIKSGLTNRLDSPNGKIKVYKCGSVIRIDIKED